MVMSLLPAVLGAVLNGAVALGGVVVLGREEEPLQDSALVTNGYVGHGTRERGVQLPYQRFEMLCLRRG